MPHFSRCERTQHKNKMAGSGSPDTFAALVTSARLGNGAVRCDVYEVVSICNFDLNAIIHCSLDGRRVNSQSTGFESEQSSRAKRLRTLDTCQRPPRRVWMPRALSAAAIWRRVVQPSSRKSLMTGASVSAKLSALAATLSRSARPPFPARLSAAAPLGLPSFTPRAFAAASASFVRREIASRSCWATSAMMPTVRSLASGMSTARNRTPLSRRVSRKAALRLSRSSLAMTRVAPVSFARLQRLVEFGRSLRRPLSTSVKRRDHRSAPARGEVVDRLALRLQTEPGAPLPRRRDPLVGDQLQDGAVSLDHVQTCLTLVAQVCTSLGSTVNRSAVSRMGLSDRLTSFEMPMGSSPSLGTPAFGPRRL